MDTVRLVQRRASFVANPVDRDPRSVEEERVEAWGSLLDPPVVGAVEAKERMNLGHGIVNDLRDRHIALRFCPCNRNLSVVPVDGDYDHPVR